MLPRLGFCLVLGTVYAVLAATVLHGSVDGDRLSRSVERQLDAGARIYDDAPYVCARQGGPEQWQCLVPNSDSGLAGYRVVVRAGTSCWDARLERPGSENAAGMPRSVSGCVRRWEPSLF